MFQQDYRKLVYGPAWVYSVAAKPSVSHTISPLRTVSTQNSFLLPIIFARPESRNPNSPCFKRNTAMSASAPSLKVPNSVRRIALAGLTVVWLSYVYGHLGLSLLIASVIGTPGCEMRAIPHLSTIVTGRETAEHYCPGFFNGLDKWEGRKSG